LAGSHEKKKGEGFCGERETASLRRGEGKRNLSEEGGGSRGRNISIQVRQKLDRSRRLLSKRTLGKKRKQKGKNMMLTH